MNACAAGIAAQRLGLGTGIGRRAAAMVLIRLLRGVVGLVGGLARASRPFLRGKKWARPVAKPLMSVADALPLPAPPIYARLPVDRALADRSFDAPDNSRAWLEALRADGPRRTDAIADLHELLLRAARFEIGQRRAAPVRPRRGSSTTCVCRRRTTRWWPCWRSWTTTAARAASPPGRTSSALLEAGVRLRRRRQRGREVARARAGRRSDPAECGAHDRGRRPPARAQARGGQELTSTSGTSSWRSR